MADKYAFCRIRFSWENKSIIADKTFQMLPACVKRLQATWIVIGVFGKIMATAQNIHWCDLDVRLIAIDSDTDELVSTIRVLKGKGYWNYYIPLVKKVTTARTPDQGWFISSVVLFAFHSETCAMILIKLTLYVQ